MGEWEALALCRFDDDPDAWFPTGKVAADAHAIQVCLRCPVRSECLALALERNLPGIWAGTSEKERMRMRRQQVNA